MDLDLIQDLLTEGIAVIPTKNDKSPALPKGHKFLYERIQLEEIDKYFSPKTYGIGIPCGKVSEGIECLDFDDHDGTHGAEAKMREFCSNPFTMSLINSNKVYVQRTPNNGFHVVYRYDSKTYEGGRKLAMWPDGEVMIETRGNGQYFVTYPTPGYKVMYNDYFGLRSIDKQDRDLLIEIAIQLNKYQVSEDQQVSDKKYKPVDPVSYYNHFCGKHSRNLLRDRGWKCEKPNEEIQQWTRPGKSQGTSATFGFRDNLFYVFSSNGFPFERGVFYSPFEILCLLEFDKNWKAAYNWIVEKYISKNVPYLRIGTNYFKKICKRDRFGILRKELKVWTKDEIKTDHGAAYIEKIPKFNTFTLDPDNKNFKPIIDDAYNLYNPFPHKAVPGDWKWTKILMQHVFGNQYEIGIKYIQSLYQHPKKALPILALVSKERSTGKTTFLNWLNMLFGENMVIVDPHDITGSFNSIYASANIIAIEETVIEKRMATEKIKSLSTGKFISVNEKYISNYKLPFYGHIIMTSNEINRFINIDQEEIRFFIRELGKPKFENYTIEEDVINEIPAFLAYLDSLPELDYTRSRALFTPEEIANENLQRVKKESKSWLFEELLTELEDFFNSNDNIISFYATTKDLKNRFFPANHKIDYRFIRRVLTDELDIKPEKMMRFSPFENIDDMTVTKPGTPFLFSRDKIFEILEKKDGFQIEKCPF